MINQEQNTTNINPLEEIQKDKIQQLKNLFPNVIDSDGNLNYSALKEEVSAKRIVNNTQGYELTFAGKGLARALADEPTIKELVINETQSKYYDEQSKEWKTDTTGIIGNSQNTVIRGDNIDTLKILNANYHNKIKMIYIDPPYNTESENFVYKDNFKETEQDLIEKYGLGEYNINFLENVYGTRSHSGWLSFIYPRLKLAKELLKDDGVIFISIDDNEQANLKTLCDEIFGEENFISSLHVELSATQGMKVASAQKGNIVKNGEHILVYAKSILNHKFHNILYTAKEWDTHYSLYYNYDLNIKSTLLEFLNSDNIPLNLINQHGYKKLNKNDIIELYNGATWFKDYIHSISKYIFQDAMIDINCDLTDKEQEELTKGNYIQYNHSNEKSYFLKKTSSKKIRQLLSLDLAIGKTDDFIPKNQIRKIRGDWWAGYYKDMMNINKEGGNIIFKNGKKPTRLIRDIIKIATNKDDNDLILDFFAGSGTTGDAVMQLNAEDNGNRKFILCQWDEQIHQKKSSESYNFCIENDFKPVISSITIERLNRAGNKILSEHNNQNLDIGYNVFTLTNKTEIQTKNDQLELYNKTHRETNHLNTLYNMIVSTGKPLNSKIEEIIKNTLYKISGEFYLINTIDISTLTQTLTTSPLYLDPFSPTLTLQTLLNLQQHIPNLKVVY